MLKTLNDWATFFEDRGIACRTPEAYVFKAPGIDVTFNLLDNGDVIELIQIVVNSRGEEPQMTLLRVRNLRDQQEDAESNAEDIRLVAEAIYDPAMAPALAGIEWAGPIMEEILRCSA